MPAEAFRHAHEALDLCGRFTLSKWDHTPLYEVSSSGSFDRWPSGEGFSHFYGFLVFAWEAPSGERLLVKVNYAPNQSQCYVRLSFTDLGNGQWRLEDVRGHATDDREGNDLPARGLYLDVLPWQTSVFALRRG